MAATGDVSAAKALLQAGGAGSLYDHLTDVLAAVLSGAAATADASPSPSSHPAAAASTDPLAAFERASLAVKARAATLAAAAAAAASGCPPDTLPGSAATAAHAALTRAALARDAALVEGPPPAPAAPAHDGEPAAPLTRGAVSDPSELALLEWAGLSLGGAPGAHRVYVALRRLAAARGLEGVRLWGVLHGTRADYWVAEATAPAGSDEAAAVAAEAGVMAAAASAAASAAAATAAGGGRATAAGAGDAPQRVGAPGSPNERCYYVCAGPGEPWARLPPVTPAQVAAARSLRRLLTGDLGAAVGGHPPFPGNEAAYLRARVALISAATLVAPVGALVPASGGEGGGDGEEEGGGVVPNPDEWEAPDDLGEARCVAVVAARGRVGRVVGGVGV